MSRVATKIVINKNRTTDTLRAHTIRNANRDHRHVTAGIPRIPDLLYFRRPPTTSAHVVHVRV